MYHAIFKTMSARAHLQRGVSLIEALVALVVIAVGMLSLAQVQVQLRANADFSRQRAEAVRLAQEDMEHWRAFSAMATAAGSVAYADIASQASAALVTANANTPFSLRRDVVSHSDPEYKTMKVTVTWPDRAGATQTVSIESLISRTNPALAAQLAIPPSGSPIRNALGRNVRIPTTAIDLGNHKSGFTPPGQSSGYYVFSNSDATIIQYCTGALDFQAYANILANNNNFNGNSCTNRYGYTLSGFINFDLRNNVSAISPGSTVCDFYADLQAANLIATTNPTLALNSVVLDRSSVTPNVAAPVASTERPREFTINAVTLASTTPSDLSVNVSVSNNLIVTLSSSVVSNPDRVYFNSTSTVVTLKDSNGNTIETFFAPTSGASSTTVRRSGDNTSPSGTGLAIVSKNGVLTLDPTASLAANTAYQLVIDASRITFEKTTGQGATEAGSGTFTVAFSTGAGPTLSTTSPNVGGVLSNATNNLTMTFDRNVIGGTGTVTLLKSGTVVETFNVATLAGSAGGSIAFSGSTVTINPFADLDGGAASYSIQVGSTAIRDALGFTYAGIANNSTFYFTTGSNPILSSTNPTVTTQIASLSSNITMFFNETVSAGVGSVTLLIRNNGNTYSSVETFNVATGVGGSGGSITFSGSTVTINPGADLVGGATYAIQVASTAIRNTNGYRYAGISDTTTFYFTTATASTLANCPSTSAAVLNFLELRMGTSGNAVPTPNAVTSSPTGATSICYTDAASAVATAGTATIGYFCVIYVTTPNSPFTWSDTVQLYGPAGWLSGGNSRRYTVCRYHDYDNNGTDSKFEHPATYSAVGESITDQNFLVIQKGGTNLCPTDTLSVGSQTGVTVQYNTTRFQP
jgi:type IV pilus modification protein PilV